MLRYVVGIDEVGRGPLAGPLFVSAFCYPSRSIIIKNLLNNFRDSKELSPEKREELFKKADEACRKGLAKYAISYSRASSIDKYGISKVTFLAVKRSLKKLKVNPKYCLVLLDGSLKAPPEYKNQKTIIKGDKKVKAISCASVLAKVKRDRFMVRISKIYPEYQFEKHKGYGTLLHRNLIKKHKPSEIHRMSFLKNLNLNI